MNKFLRYSLVATLFAVFGYSYAADVKFDFIANGLSMFSSITAGSTSDSNAGDITSEISTTLEGVKMTISPSTTSTANRLWVWSEKVNGEDVQGVQLRMYSGTLKLSASEAITKVVFEEPSASKKWTAPTPNAGSFDGTTWTGSTTELELTFTGQCRMNSITVTVGGSVTPGPGPDPQPTEGTVFDFDNKADELFPGMGRSSGSNDTYVADGEFTENTTSTAVNGATVTISASDAEAKTKNRLWATSPVLRLYNGTLTVTAPENIKTMTFTVGWNSNNKVVTWNTGNTVSTGTLTIGDQSDQTVKWTGNAKEVVFTIAANTQIKKLELGFEEAVPELVISGVTPFEGSTTVTITGGNSIYYTIDGTDPETNEAAPLYTGPFTLTESATVKAWDELLNIKAEKTFTKKEMKVVNSIAEFIALAKDDKAVLNLSNAVCVYTWTSNNNTTLAYVRDDSGALNFFNTGINMAKGDVLNGSIILQKDEYNNLPEAVKAGDMTVSDNLLISSGSEPEARSIVIKNIGNYLSDLVELANVSITTEEGTQPGGGGDDPTPTGDKIKFDFDNNADALFPSMAGKRSSGNGATYVADGEFTSDMTTTAVNGATVTVSASPSDAADKNRLWATPAVLRLYNGTLTVNAPAGKTMSAVTFNLAKNASSSRWGNDNTFSPEGTVTPVPEDGVYDKKTNFVTWTGSASQLVLNVAKNTQIGSIEVTLAGASSAPRRADATKYYAKDADGNTVQVYNNYHLSEFDDYSKFVNDKKYDVKGIVTVYKTTYELYTLEINEATATAIQGIAEERLDVNAPIYNLSGQEVNKSFKGVVIQNGKKYILR